MKRMIKKICCVIFLTVGILFGLCFLSTIPAFNPIINMLTNSVNYDGMGKMETFFLWEKVKQPSNARKVIFGDSVANQLYEYRENNEYRVVTGNMSMTLIWQYIFVRDYLEMNPQTTDVYLCFTSDIFEHSFETGMSYNYMLIPLAQYNQMDVLEEKQTELLKDMFGTFFINPKVACFIGNSGLNTKLYLNAVKKFYEWFPGRKDIVEKTQNPDFELAETYLLKIKELCEEKDVKLHMLPNPQKDTPENRMYLEKMKEKYRNSSLHQMNPDFFEQIVFYPEECFKDELHFTDEYLEEDGKVVIIKEIQKATGKLAGLIKED